LAGYIIGKIGPFFTKIRQKLQFSDHSIRPFYHIFKKMQIELLAKLG